MEKEIYINTPKGRGILGYKGTPSLTISELGFVMLKIWIVEDEVFTNYRITELSEILPSGFSIIEDTTFTYEHEEVTNVPA